MFPEAFQYHELFRIDRPFHAMYPFSYRSAPFKHLDLMSLRLTFSPLSPTIRFSFTLPLVASYFVTDWKFKVEFDRLYKPRYPLMKQLLQIKKK